MTLSSSQHRVIMDKGIILDKHIVFSTANNFRTKTKQGVKAAELEANVKITPDNVASTLTNLKNLKRKLTKVYASQDDLLHKTKLRITHLAQLGSTVMSTPSHPDYARLTQRRLDVYLADYLLRQNYHSTAMQLIQDTNLDALLDLDLFKQAKTIVDALVAESCTLALQWCSENKSTLKKGDGSLEFELRLQEYVQLVKANQLSEAIKYAKTHFGTWKETHLREIQQAMALLAFNPNSSYNSLYQHYFDSERWSILVSSFLSEFFSLHQLPPVAPLKATLQAGLSSLKTPCCYNPVAKNMNCPVCLPDFSELAVKLPYSHHVNSYIVCPVTSEMMNEDNPPMVLPNGMVYSKNGLEKLYFMKDGKKWVKCFKTGQEYAVVQLRKAFIL